jgi:hypothetical protein
MGRFSGTTQNITLCWCLERIIEVNALNTVPILECYARKLQRKFLPFS